MDFNVSTPNVAETIIRLLKEILMAQKNNEITDILLTLRARIVFKKI